MERKDIRNAVLTHLAGMGTKFVPAGVSARHVHLSQEDLAALFGPSYSLQPCKPLSQPGQFAAAEKVCVAGPRGEIQNVRVLGPVRGRTQVEMTFSELMRLGIPGEVRMSGNIGGTPGCILRGPAGQVCISCGVIVPARHLHMSPLQAAAFGLKDGEAVTLRMNGPRPGQLEQVICRVGEAHDLEVHLDTDEANAFCITDSTLLEVVAPAAEKPNGSCGGKCGGSCGCGGFCEKKEIPPSEPETPLMDLVTERDVEDAWKRGISVIRCLPRCIVTDAARERAMSLEIEIKR